MQQNNDNTIKQILDYDTKRQYFGPWTVSGLHYQYAQLRVSQSWDSPLYSVMFAIGQLNGDIICNALWREMSLNPARFGTVSPFVFDGKNNIYKFCADNRNYSPDTRNKQLPDGRDDVVMRIANNLSQYMSLNSDKNGAWRDEIVTVNGTVQINWVGHSDDTYKKLACLCECIKFIAKQNIRDVKRKRGPYREGIINSVDAMFPNGTRPQSFVPFAVPSMQTPQQPVDVPPVVPVVSAQPPLASEKVPTKEEIIKTFVDKKGQYGILFDEFAQNQK